MCRHCDNLTTVFVGPAADNYRKKVEKVRHEKALKELESLLKCKKHPRYQMKRKPTSKCKKCWDLWSLTTFKRTLQ
jgi:hypothetical protein